MNAGVASRKEITVQDCEHLYKMFTEYTETAEQHEFVRLAMVNTMLDSTMAQLRASRVVNDQKEARAMFRVVLKVIGKDASDYEEEKK